MKAKHLIIKNGKAGIEVDGSFLELEDQEWGRFAILTELINGPSIDVPFALLTKENHPYEVPEFEFIVTKHRRSKFVAVIVEHVKEEKPVMKSTKEVLAEHGLISNSLNKEELAKESREIYKRMEDFRRSELPGIFDNSVLRLAFRDELIKGGDVNKAIWYTLRDAPTNKYLSGEKQDSQEKLWDEVGTLIHQNGTFRFYPDFQKKLQEQFTITRKQ